MIAPVANKSKQRSSKAQQNECCQFVEHTATNIDAHYQQRADIF